MDEASARRFHSKIQIADNGCWLWTGTPTGQNYGRFWLDGKSHYAHVVAYREFVGPLPEGYQVDHACHTRDETCPGGPTCQHRLCVNYQDGHLEAVTPYTNVMRSRGPAAVNTRKVFCKNGHPLEGANLFRDSRGDRGCRTCQAQRVKEWTRENRWKGGIPAGERTQCPQGHPYDNSNTKINSQGKRVCIICTRASNRESARRRRAAQRAAARGE